MGCLVQVDSSFKLQNIDINRKEYLHAEPSSQRTVLPIDKRSNLHEGVRTRIKQAYEFFWLTQINLSPGTIMTPSELLRRFSRSLGGVSQVLL